MERNIERKSRYSRAEADKLQALADQSALDVASYMRFQSIGPTVGSRLPNEAELKAVVVELRRVGMLINQIAKAANAGFYRGEHVPTQELGDMFENTSKLFKREILRLKSVDVDLADQ